MNTGGGKSLALSLFSSVLSEMARSLQATSFLSVQATGAEDEFMSVNK